MAALHAEAEEQGIDLNKVEFAARRALLPYRCKTTGNMVWPLARIYVGRQFRRDPENQNTLIIERIKLSDAEYMLFQLTGKNTNEYQGDSA